MKALSIIVLFISATNAFGGDVVAKGRFQKVQVESILNAAVSESLIEKDGSRAVIRVAVDLDVEGNLGECEFKNFSSSLEYNWQQENPSIYLEIITTSCPTPKPLDLIMRGSTTQSSPRVITTTFDLDLYNRESREVTVLTGPDRKGKSNILVSFAAGKITTEVKP